MLINLGIMLNTVEKTFRVLGGRLRETISGYVQEPSTDTFAVLSKVTLTHDQEEPGVEPLILQFMDD